MIKFTREKPEWAKLSQHLCEKAEGYVTFLLSGRHYCVPLTPDIKKVCGIERRGDELIFKRGGEWKFNCMLMTIADVLYLQMRDTVGSEITEELSGQLKDFLEDKFTAAIGSVVEKKLESGLALPEHTEGG